MSALTSGLTMVEAVRATVVSDPEILGGMQVIQGTRVPVYDVAASVAAGDSMDEILAAYPTLDRDQVELAVQYAEAHPPDECLRPLAGLPEGAKLVRHQTIRLSLPTR